ncbi:MAG: glycosyl hydrolase family 65 protein [Verrucomicrobiota bacterium]
MSETKSTRYLKVEPWSVTESGYHPKRSRVSESIFSLANEFMGIRGFFEEGYSGDTLVGSYFNGVFDEMPIKYPLLLRGSPERTHFMVNSVNWLYTRLSVGGEELDLAKVKFSQFRRSLDFRTGVMSRSFVWKTKKGRELKVSFQRYLGMKTASLGAQRIELTPLNFSGAVKLIVGLDFSPLHESEDTCYWNAPRKGKQGQLTAILGETLASGQKILSAFRYDSSVKPSKAAALVDRANPKLTGQVLEFKATRGETLRVDKLVANLSELRRGVTPAQFWKSGLTKAGRILCTTFDAALRDNLAYWDAFWKKFDLSIEGDPANEQGTRYCMFQMHATYHGVDPQLNIGAKGLTGEVYGGLTFWDTETYCLPFYIFTDPEAARNLIRYRFHRLPQARERARQMGCEGARYPMTTIDGTEACVVWNHGDIEIHVPAAVAYGLWHYVRVSGDEEFLFQYGVEMLLEVSRFYASHGEFSPKTGEFGLWGVMGADEFHMMVHNNAYTNTIVKKTFEWTLDALKRLQKKDPKRYAALAKRLKTDAKEQAKLKKMAAKMRLQRDEKTGLIEQHDGFFDLPPVDLDKLPDSRLPVCKKNPYVMRSRYNWIKQPDVLLLHFFFSHDYSLAEKKINYEYYEPLCAHESSLSPGVHSILAAELGKEQIAFDYVRYASRLDLDDFNGNTREGLHMTSMAAAWMSLVYGFGGMRSDGVRLSFKPNIPRKWKAFSFRVLYRDALIEVKVDHGKAVFTKLEGPSVKVDVYGKTVTLGAQPYETKLAG